MAFVAMACNIDKLEAYFAKTRAWVATEGQRAPLAILEERNQHLWDLREAANEAAGGAIRDHEIRRRYLRLAVAIEEYEALEDLISLAAGY